MIIREVKEVDRICELIGVSVPGNVTTWKVNSGAVVEVLYLQAELDLMKGKGLTDHPLFLTGEEMQAKIAAAQKQVLFPKNPLNVDAPMPSADEIAEAIAGVQPMPKDGFAKTMKALADAQAHMHDMKASETFINTEFGKPQPTELVKVEPVKVPETPLPLPNHTEIAKQMVSLQELPEEKLGQVMHVPTDHPYQYVPTDHPYPYVLPQMVRLMSPMWG